MRIEDIEIKPNNKRFDEKNWDINEWRKEYPVDYFNLSAMLVKPDEAILRDEVFKALYKSIRLYIPDTDKVKVSTTSAKRGQIIDRNGQLLAGEGVASSIGVVPGNLENKNDAISQLAELLEMKTEDIEKISSKMGKR